MASSEKWVGQGIERFEDEALLSGRARFIDDLEPVPGLCHAAILRSPYGSADILHVNAEAARGMSGVIGVLTPDDVAGRAPCDAPPAACAICIGPWAGVCAGASTAKTSETRTTNDTKTGKLFTCPPFSWGSKTRTPGL